MRTLLTWSDRGADGTPPAHHGTRPASDRGPIVRLLEQPESVDLYDRAVLLCPATGLGAARKLATEVRTFVPAVDVLPLTVPDPTDHARLFQVLGPVLERSWDGPVDVLLSAGTPQMQTTWVVLVKAGLLDARMLQVIPAAFVPRPHPKAVREVRLDFEGFPEIRALKDEVERLRTETAVSRGLVARSPAMKALVRQIARIAPTEIPVLVEGETGSGKELVARAIHRASARASGPFVGENVAALDDGTLASELFGHEKGAFTGAGERRAGLFESAHRGTLFLDEIGELPPRVQVSLLRAIQEGVIRRVGGEKPVRVDVRIVAATHRDLREQIAEKSFREDLFYRLNGATLRVPPLRERPEDLEPLVRAFLAEAGRPGLVVTPESWRVLQKHPWPGNVRELRSEVFRWAVFCDQRVRPVDLSLEAGVDRAGRADSSSAPAVGPLAAAVTELERRLVARAMELAGGNLSQAARSLSIDRNTLKRKLAASL